MALTSGSPILASDMLAVINKLRDCQVKWKQTAMAVPQLQGSVLKATLPNSIRSGIGTLPSSLGLNSSIVNPDCNYGTAPVNSVAVGQKATPNELNAALNRLNYIYANYNYCSCVSNYSDYNNYSDYYNYTVGGGYSDDWAGPVQDC